MSFQHHGADAICYAPCFYNEIQVPFRGPKRSLDGRYIACLGGAGMFGKFVPQALPDLLETGLGVPAVNLAQINAGVDFMSMREVVSIAENAVCTVIDLVGAHNLSNRFYRVHPRRNDRLIAATPLLRELFPTLDLADVHFTRHLLALMKDTAPSRMEAVIEELKHVWLERMHGLLAQLPGPVVLLWMGGGPVPDCADDYSARLPFLDARMVTQIAEVATEVIIIDDAAGNYSSEFMSLSNKHRPQLKLLPSAQEVSVAANEVAHVLARYGVGEFPVERACSA